jgi:hypothetical protein
MNSGRSGKFFLSVNISGLADFSAVGIIREPSLALARKSEALQKGQHIPGTVVIHALATKIAGRCLFDSAEAENTVRAFFSSRLAAEWQIAIPQAGVLQALFLVARLQSARQPGRLFDLALQLAGKPEFEAVRPDPGKPSEQV